MTRRGRRTSGSSIRHITLSIVMLLVATFFIISIVRIKEKHAFVKAEKRIIEEEIRESQAALESLERTLETTDSPDAQERLLRDQFRVASEGEELIVIIPEE